MKGQFELARRGAIDQLQRAMTDAETLLGRLHAVWGLGQLIRNQPELLGLLLPAFEGGEPELIAQAAKVTGETQGGIANVKALRAGLEHESPRVKFFCAIAVGNRGDKGAAELLVKLLETGGAKDPYLRHAAVMGLKGAMTPEQLAGLANHPSRSVRLGSIVALRKLASPEVREFLDDADELVLLEAARAIHDDASIPAALGDLSALLEENNYTNEALMRRVINAAFRNGTQTDLERLGRYIESGKGMSSIRRTALAAILWWSQPPVLDAVEGRYRKHEPRDAGPANRLVTRLKPTVFADVELGEVLLNGVVQRGIGEWLDGADERFAEWPPALQTRYLNALAKSKHADLKEYVERALTSQDTALRETARGLAKQAGVPTVDLLLTILADPNPAGQGKAVLQLAQLDDPVAKKKLIELADLYRAGKANPEWKLELWQAAKTVGIKLEESPDRLEFGGDAKRGKKLVMSHAAAQCIRCHRVGKEGGEASLGPDLTKIGATRDRAHLVAAMLDPGREITAGFGTVV